MVYYSVLLICMCTFTIGFVWRQLFKTSGGNLGWFYFLHLLLSVFVILLFYINDPTLFQTLSQMSFSGDIKIPGYLIDTITMIFAFPLIFELPFFFVTGLENKRKYLISYKGTLLPNYLLPKNYFQLFLFVLFILESVVLEEIVFRQVFFGVLGKIGNINIVAVILLSSLFFSLAHFKRPIKEIIILFLEGCALAIYYYWTKSILAVIGLHFLLNFTEAIVAYKLIFWEKKVSDNLSKK